MKGDITFGFAKHAYKEEEDYPRSMDFLFLHHDILVIIISIKYIIMSSTYIYQLQTSILQKIQIYGG